MNELLSYAQPIGIFALVLICLNLVRMNNGKMKNKIDREVCQTAMKSVDDKFQYINDDLKEIKTDIKSLLKR